ncbi:MAG: hypothetical protein MZV63_28625 [Marinilabiliales bacterium]|nr:hypothetical protein [Marinilabiliales bacterium]
MVISTILTTQLLILSFPTSIFILKQVLKMVRCIARIHIKAPIKTMQHLNFTTLLKYPVILKENGTMSFDEVVLVEPGEVLSKFGDEDFWDYVIVEGSKDKGKTWLPIANGYDSGDNPIWKTNYNKNIDNNQVSNTVGIPEWYVNREIKLLENGNFKANDTILIQFRLYSDPYAHGWGWTIDNLRIQTPVSTSNGHIIARKYIGLSQSIQRYIKRYHSGQKQYR